MANPRMRRWSNEVKGLFVRNRPSFLFTPSAAVSLKDQGIIFPIVNRRLAVRWLRMTGSASACADSLARYFSYRHVISMNAGVHREVVSSTPARNQEVSEVVKRSLI